MPEENYQKDHWQEAPKEIKKGELPRISFVIATYNSGQFVEETVKSIIKQEYPQDKIEIIFSDGGSKDNTLEIAKKYPLVRVVENELILGDPGYAFGCQEARGDLVVFVGHDNRLVQKNWLRMMVKPFMESDIAGAFPHLENRKQDSWLTKYVNKFTDPFNHFVYEFANNPLTFSKVYKEKERGDGWVVFDFNLDNHPLLAFDQGFTLKKKGFYREKRTWFCDILPVLEMIKQGKKLAYVPLASNYHETLNGGLRQFIKKHRWAVAQGLSGKTVYGPEQKDFGFKAREKHLSLRRKARAFIYPFYGISFFIPCLRTIYKLIADKEKEWIYHPFITFVSAFIIWEEAVKILIFRQDPVINRY